VARLLGVTNSVVNRLAVSPALPEYRNYLKALQNLRPLFSELPESASEPTSPFFTSPFSCTTVSPQTTDAINPELAVRDPVADGVAEVGVIGNVPQYISQ